MPSATRGRQLVWPVLKWTLFALVLAFVANRALAMWRSDGASLAEMTLHWPWLAAAALYTFASWLPSVWFWQRLMRRLGSDLPFLPTARAYYCGHLGKYVPGKATVIVIRAGLAKQYGLRAAPAALAVTYETLAMMGSGAAVAAALAPWLLTAEHQSRLPGWTGILFEHPWIAPLAVVVATAALLPVIAELLNRIAVRMTPADVLEREGPARIDARVLAGGLAAYLVTWSLQGLALDATLLAIGVTGLTLPDVLFLAGAMAFATSAGFAVLIAPGGLGVREGLLIAALASQPLIAPSQAVAASVLTRVLALLVEIAAALVLYLAIRPPRTPR